MTTAEPQTTWRAQPHIHDAMLAFAVLLFALVEVSTDLGDRVRTPPNAGSYVLVAGAAAALLLRRRHPMAVLAVVATCRVALRIDIGNDAALVPAAMVALYTVARTGDRRRNVGLAVLVGLVLAATVAALDRDPFRQEFLGEAALMLLPIAIADATRSRADRVRELIDTEADQRVAAERLRIARDLHDVVAHGLSTIAVQSGVAAHLIDREPDQAKLALETINETGKSALEELRVMVGVLRSTDDTPLRPTPTDPNDLTDLVESAANAGIEVIVSTTGQFPAGVGDSCVVAVHRIVQEALTNVARHAGQVPVALSIDHEASEVRLAIVNASGTAPDISLASTGVGIIGMRERAEALGGTLRAGPLDSGGFEVVATIPYDQRNAPRERP